MSDQPHPPRVQNNPALAPVPSLEKIPTADLGRELAYRVSPERYKYETLDTVDELIDLQATITTGITSLAIARSSQSVSGRLTPRIVAAESRAVAAESRAERAERLLSMAEARLETPTFGEPVVVEDGKEIKA